MDFTEKVEFQLIKISELHGNQNLEICENCNKGYMRDFRVRTAKKNHDH